MSDSPLTEKTQISLTISSWWHVVIIVGTIIACYFGLQAKTDEALSMSRDTAAKQAILSDQLHGLQMNIQSITDNVKYFREQYERDKGRR